MRPVWTLSPSSTPGQVHELVLRRLELRAQTGPLDLAVQHDLLPDPEHLREEALVEEDGARRARGVAHLDLEDREARSTRRLDLRLDDLAGDGGRAGPQVGDRDDVSAVLVAKREAEQQIFDGPQACRRQRRAARRPDAWQVAERGLERIGRRHCRTVTCPGSTRISRIDEGRSNGRRDRCLGSSGERVARHQLRHEDARQMGYRPVRPTRVRSGRCRSRSPAVR